MITKRSGLTPATATFTVRSNVDGTVVGYCGTHESALALDVATNGRGNLPNTEPTR